LDRDDAVKVRDIEITENQVVIGFADQERTEMFRGQVDYTLTVDRTGKLNFYVEVIPRKTDVPLRPATPNRNVR
jgi:hypothetical protein